LIGPLIRRRALVALALVSLCVSALTDLGPLAPFDEDAGGACGVERWSVKTGTDADAGSIDLAHVVPTSIADLTSLPKPGSLPANSRIGPTETTVYSITATLTVYKHETDSDYHVVISDGSRTMIAESADIGCVGRGSPLANGIQQARAKLDARLSPTSNFKTADLPVTVTGVGFFDFLHGQTGVAPNGIELHPLLDVVFNDTTPTPSPTPTLTPSPTPTPGPTTCQSSTGPGIAPPSGVPAGLDGFHAAWFGQSGYQSLCPGARATGVVAYYNSGSRGWVSGRLGEVAYLGTWNPVPGQDQPSVLGGDGTMGSPNTAWPRFNRVAIQPADYVGPGQIAWFQFDVLAPLTPGTYQLAIRPLIEGAQWMEDYGVFWIVVVLNPDGSVPPSPPPPPPPPPPPGSGNVAITALRYDGVVFRTEADEYVQITNSGPGGQNMSGWRIVSVRGGQAYTFPAMTIAPGQTCRVYTNEIHPEWCGLSWGRGSAVWNNAGDRANLDDPTGAVVSTFGYGGY
jgi:hypothetical protein